ncbi:MAG: hypothetical protein QOJ29_1791 [Thermoleophilaceae bacterium]|jgi:hypothetical protein|nr:hypothetical protein [Thermoleophilaceae bacterium]
MQARNSLKARIHRTLRRGAAAASLAGVLFATTGTPTASADVIQSRNGATWIWVGTGAKNYSNHTQWVSYITVMTGSQGTCPSKLEAWTYGFYVAQQVCGPAAVTWYISKWVPTGNNVCGASSWTLWNSVWRRWVNGRDTACISIRV